MNKKIIISLFIGILIGGLIKSPVNALTDEDLILNESYSIPILKVVETNSKKELEELIAECNNRQFIIHDTADNLRVLGYEEDSYYIQGLKVDWCNTEEIKKEYNNHLQEIIQKHNEYIYSSIIWEELEKEGFNKYIIAGILGNIMNECGGNTLSLTPTAKGNYYGICQWSKGYSEVWDKDIYYQIRFLISTLEYEINTYGYKYKKEFKYSDFIALENEKDAAVVFAKCYERCSSTSYVRRQSNATKALSYYE